MYYKIGNIALKVSSGIILHQVNCQGKMGSGVAKSIKNQWPIVFNEYIGHCNYSREAGDLTGESLLGEILPVKIKENLYVINLFSQQYYGKDHTRYTSYDALDDCLIKVQKFIDTNFNDEDVEYPKVHHPQIGSGLGGGSWNIIEAIITNRLGTQTTSWSLT